MLKLVFLSETRILKNCIKILQKKGFIKNLILRIIVKKEKFYQNDAITCTLTLKSL